MRLRNDSRSSVLTFDPGRSALNITSHWIYPCTGIHAVSVRETRQINTPALGMAAAYCDKRV